MEACSTCKYKQKKLKVKVWHLFHDQTGCKNLEFSKLDVITTLFIP